MKAESSRFNECAPGCDAENRAVTSLTEAHPKGGGEEPLNVSTKVLTLVPGFTKVMMPTKTNPTKAAKKHGKSCRMHFSRATGPLMKGWRWSRLRTRCRTRGTATIRARIHKVRYGKAKAGPMPGEARTGTATPVEAS